MTAQIEKTEAYDKLAQFQKELVIKRANRLQIENAIIVVGTIGYDNWEKTTKFPSHWRAIVKELVNKKATP